jgi:hypothetical protein|tara:strand:+ start:122 stop:415 length:294 start_codon:yes stop_codon:yes gene_type:complete
MSWNLLPIAQPWNNLNDVPVHLRGMVKRARDSRLYAELDVPAAGDVVKCNWDRDKEITAVVTAIDLPTVYFVYPDGTESSSGIRGITLVSRKNGRDQ